MIAAGQTTGGAWTVFFAIPGIAAILASAYIFVALFEGRGLPDMGEERRTKKREQEHEAALAQLARGHAFQELLDELDANLRDLRIQLGNDRTFGVFHSSSAWARNQTVVDEQTRDVVQDAYSRMRALDQSTRERHDAASHDDVNNPA